MKSLRSIKRSLRLQKGDFLLESMISLVLISIVGLGEVHVAAKALKAQKDMRMQELAINQMRAALIANSVGGYSLCPNVPVVTLPGNPVVQTAVSGCAATTSVVINGVTVNNVPVPLSITANSDVFSGAIEVGGKWETL